MKPLDEIRAFRAISETIATAGQPNQDQFVLLRDAGFKAVINLALPTSDNAIPNEGSIVTSLRMGYFHIPVDFQCPQVRDFQTFCQLMQAHADRKVFVHCAANMRVSAFILLYRVNLLGVAIDAAQIDLHAIWQPNTVWSQFISDNLR
ncbi:MAG: protein tyrosine phosphatase family protein [Armatimonadota bacterium]